MQLTEEHEHLRKLVEDFVDTEINPYVETWEEAREFPSHELFKKLGDLGLLGVHYPEEYGGMGLDYSYAVVVAEALGTCHAGGIPMAIGVQSDMCTPALARFGSDELRQEFLAPAIAGDQVGCIGVSEPNAGSDVAGLRTVARPDGDDYIIDGTKMWITNGLKADWCCVLANTGDRGGPHKNKSLIMVPLDAPGIERQKIEKLGMWSSDTAQLFFDGVRVPKRYLVGQENAGFLYQMWQFQEERLWGAANSLRMLDGVIDETIAYTRGRKAFGRPILDNQVVHYKLAELRTEVELLRSLVYRATEAYVRGEDILTLASMAKLKCGRLCREVLDSCLQFWGGMGYSHESRISRAYRDARLISIGGGADEVMLGIIAKQEGTLPKFVKPPKS
ncbi:MAG: acyl-CoA dehydrogenase family protein [Myxococcales bacterium]|nr:acyl-CoA dehydrogenase family protein [Myxococcales bacterium]